METRSCFITLVLTWQSVYLAFFYQLPRRCATKFVTPLRWHQQLASLQCTTQIAGVVELRESRLSTPAAYCRTVAQRVVRGNTSWSGVLSGLALSFVVWTSVVERKFLFSTFVQTTGRDVALTANPHLVLRLKKG